MPCGCCCLHCFFRSALLIDVWRDMVLPGASERDLDAAAGASGVHLMETVRKSKKLWVSLPVCAAVAAAGGAAGNAGHDGLLRCRCADRVRFYIFRGRKWWCLLGQVLTLYWINVVLLGGLMYPIRLFGMEFELCQQGLALLALVPIWLYRGRQGCHSKPFQYACYAFYPVHMLLLVLALNFVNR